MAGFVPAVFLPQSPERRNAWGFLIVVLLSKILSLTNIFDTYDFIRFVCDKDGKGQPSPADATRSLDVAQMWLFNKLRRDGELNNFTPPALSVFLTDAPFTTTHLGYFTKPAGYAQCDRLVNSDGQEYLPILQNEIRDALKSSLEPIADYPRYFEAGSSIKILPATKRTGTLTYLKVPTTPNIGFTLNSDNEPVYDPGTSVELEFGREYWMDIIINALSYIGVSMADTDVLALAGLQTTNP